MTGLQASPRNPFATHVGGDRQRALVRLIGELDVASVPSAEHAIVQAERFDPSLLELDLSSLVFMDSTGLRLLLNARQRASEARRRLLLHRGPDAVQRVFEITALDRFFEFVD